MSEPSKNTALLGEAFRSEIEEIVKKAVREAMGQNGHGGKVSLRVLINMLKPYHQAVTCELLLPSPG